MQKPQNEPQILAKQQSQIITDLIATNINHSYEPRIALFFSIFLFLFFISKYFIDYMQRGTTHVQRICTKHYN